MSVIDRKTAIDRLQAEMIMVDRHLVRAERLLADDDPAAAAEAMNEIHPGYPQTDPHAAGRQSPVQGARTE